MNSNAKARRSSTLQFVTPITSVLYFGQPSREGELDVQLAFDHRVFDGVTGYRVTNELECVLNAEMAAETRISGRSHGHAEQEAA